MFAGQKCPRGTMALSRKELSMDFDQSSEKTMKCRKGSVVAG